MDPFDRVRKLMAEIFQVSEDKITRGTGQDDLEGWDSVGHLNLMLALEQEFSVALEVEDLSALTSVPEILDYLKSSCPSR